MQSSDTIRDAIKMNHPLVYDAEILLKVCTETETSCLTWKTWKSRTVKYKNAFCVKDLCNESAKHNLIPHEFPLEPEHTPLYVYRTSF